jgi:hypothetical protein
MNAHPRAIKAAPARDPRPSSEFELQRFVVQCLQFNRRAGVIFYHCPNGESRSKRTGAKLKAMGVLPGVADICLVLPGGASAFLELKRPDGRASVEQRLFRSECETSGAGYAIATNPEEAVAVLLRWGALKTDPLRSTRAA